MEKLEARLVELRRNNIRADVTDVIETEFDRAQNREEKLHLLTKLASAYYLIEKPKDAETAIRRQIQLAPDDTLVWAHLAEHHLYHTEELEDALRTINLALEKATATNMYVRMAHGVRVRIALELERYDLVEESLKELLCHKPEVGSDVVLEDDFVDRIPLSAISGDIVNRYREAAKAEIKQVSEARIKRDRSNESQ